MKIQTSKKSHNRIYILAEKELCVYGFQLIPGGFSDKFEQLEFKLVKWLMQRNEPVRETTNSQI